MKYLNVATNFFLHYLVLLLFSHYVTRTGYLWNTSPQSSRLFSLERHVIFSFCQLIRHIRTIMNYVAYVGYSL
jgi:hypothetical protein